MQAEAIVLCGGLGTRLRGVVADLPKPMAPVAGRPFLAYLLDALATQGTRHVVLATGYLADKVEGTLGHEWRGMAISYSREEAPLGTGGAIREASRRIASDMFLVLNGDTYLDLSYGALAERTRMHAAMLGMALAKVEDGNRYGLVEFDGVHVRGFHEKGVHGPGRINAGVYCMRRAVIDTLPAQGAFSFETDYLVPAVERGEVVGFDDTRHFIDIGVPEDYARAADVVRHVGERPEP